MSIINGSDIFSQNEGLLKYRKLNKQSYNYVKEVSTYFKENVKDNQIYIIDPLSYYIKLVGNIKIDKYDLLNNGNLGLKTSKDIINFLDKECENIHCIFIQTNTIGDINRNQYDYELILYAIKNYQKTNQINYFSVYQNY